MSLSLWLSVQFSHLVTSASATQWTAERQASLSITSSGSLPTESVMPSIHLIFYHPLLLQSFPASGSFPMNHFFTSGGQSFGVSASASVLPLSIQDLFPFGWAGLISLLSKGLSRIFPKTTVQSINSSVLSLLYGLTLTSICDYWKNHSFNYTELNLHPSMV